MISLDTKPLAHVFIHFFPRGPALLLFPLLGDEDGQVEIAAARVDVHVGDAHERGLVPEVVAEEEEDDDGGGEVDEEEALGEGGGGLGPVADGPGADPELRDEDEDVDDEAEPGAEDADLRPEGQLGDLVALVGPGAPEPDVREADRRPGEDGREPGDGDEPVEYLAFLLEVGEVGE